MAATGQLSSTPAAARALVSDVTKLRIVLLAAIENQPRDQVEAAHLDGASPSQIFRDITWPAIAPVAATVVLIRLIEAFKIIDLPRPRSSEIVSSDKFGHYVAQIWGDLREEASRGMRDDEEHMLGGHKT